MSDSSQG